MKQRKKTTIGRVSVRTLKGPKRSKKDAARNPACRSGGCC